MAISKRATSVVIISREVMDDLEAGRRRSLPALAVGDSYSPDACVIELNQLTRIPGSVYAKLMGRSLWVRISTSTGEQLFLDNGRINGSFKNVTFNRFANLAGVDIDQEIIIELFSWDVVFFWFRIARTVISVRDLLKRPSISLLLQLDNNDILVKKSANAPCELIIKVIKVPATWPQPIESSFADSRTYAKHVMILTRGTQGDVQPFVALAIGLAEQRNFMVTICTELRYKSFVKKHAKNLTRGAIRFRPSGGDTTVRVQSDLARWALHTKSALVQGAILASSEAEFFGSEAVFFHWAELLKPDGLIYGFTTATIAMILSEKLQLPAVGFILQPTCIPSADYPPLQVLSDFSIPLVTNLVNESVFSHGFLSAAKSVLDSSMLGAMRKRRGLPPTSTLWYKNISDAAPVVVPINPVAFGGRPADWNPAIELTDFIYLGGGSSCLDPELVSFLDIAKADGAPVVVIGFSSMPIPREDIARIVLKIAQRCETKPRVVALLGDSITKPVARKTAATINELVAEKRVFEARGAPYSELFKHADCVVIHGGLGATSEAMRAAIPVVCTGVLLMDQRFWGNRLSAINAGPSMTHISDFESACVAQIDEALAPDNKFLSAAQEFASRIQPSEVDPSGVAVNVEAVVRLLQTARPIGAATKALVRANELAA